MRHETARRLEFGSSTYSVVKVYLFIEHLQVLDAKKTVRVKTDSFLPLWNSGASEGTSGREGLRLWCQ